MIQDLIDNEQIYTTNTILPPNQCLGVFKNPLDNHDVNQVHISMLSGYAYHNVKLLSSYDFIGRANELDNLLEN